MRTFAALAVYVYLAEVCSGAEPPKAAPQPISSAENWVEVRNEGSQALGKQNYAAAEELFHKGWMLARTPAQSAMSSYELGMALHGAGREEEAKNWLENTVTTWKTHPSVSSRIARASETLALIYRNLGDYSGAERLLREALDEPPNDVETKATVRQELADVLREEGRNTEARRLFAEVLKFPDLSWRRKFDSVIGLADLDRDEQNWQPSIEQWNQAVEIARENEGTLVEAVALRGLGQTWEEQRKTARAEPLLRRSLETFERTPGAGGLQVASTLACLGQLYLEEDKLTLAEDALRRAIDLDEHTLGPGHPQVAIILEMLGDTLARRKRIGQAREYLERAREIMAARFGEKSAVEGAVFTTWGIIEQRSANPGQAAVEYEKALEILRPAGPDFKRLRASVLERYAEVLKATHHKQEAKAALIEAASFRSIKSGRVSGRN